MIGLNSGFFLSMCRRPRAGAAAFRAHPEGGEEKASVSSITLFEILHHGLRGAVPRELADTVVDRAGAAFVRADVDNRDVLRRAAAIAHGMELAMADALIAASLERVGCTRLDTTDNDFDRYDGPMQIEYL